MVPGPDTSGSGIGLETCISIEQFEPLTGPTQKGRYQASTFLVQRGKIEAVSIVNVA